MKRIEIYSMKESFDMVRTHIDLITANGSVADREVVEGYDTDRTDSAVRRVSQDMALAYGAILVNVGKVTASEFNALQCR